MRGLNEIITANAATSQVDLAGISKLNQKKLLDDFAQYILEKYGDCTPKIALEVFLNNYRG